jgi:hypothetical protein
MTQLGEVRSALRRPDGRIVFPQLAAILTGVRPENLIRP